MRLLARIGCTVAGLTLLAPSVTQAGMPIAAPGPSHSLARAKKGATKKFCAGCQARRMMAKGLRVSTPPPLPAGAPVKGEQCAACGAPTAVVLSGKLYRSQPPALMANNTPGRAVVGGEPVGMMAMDGGPVPIGVVAPRVGSAPSVGFGQGPGSRDGSVMPTSAVSDPIAPAVGSRPHVLSHLLGVSAIGRERADRKIRAKEEKHAMIPYGTPATPIGDVPASVIYGRRGR